MKTSIDTISPVRESRTAGIKLFNTKRVPTQLQYNNRTRRIAVSVFFFVMGLCFATWASRIPDIKSALKISDGTLGTILLALPAGQLTAMPFSGRLVTKFGSKNIARIALLFYAVCLTNIGLVQAPWQLALALYVFGVCGNMSNISVNTQAIGVEKLFERPILTSFHGVWSTAGFTGAAIGWLMVSQHLDPYVHFWIVAVFALVAVMIAQRFLVPGRTVHPTSEKKKFFSKPDGKLVQLGIIGFCSMASEGAMFDWSGVYFKQVVHAPATLTILGYVSFMVMMATGRFAGDKLILKYGRKNMLRLSGILISSGLFISVLFPYLVPATIGFLIVGLGVSSIVPMVYSAAGRVSKIPPGMALAAVSSISFLGFLMGPPLIGYIAEISSLRYSFAVIGVLGFGIAMLVSKIKALD